MDVPGLVKREEKSAQPFRRPQPASAAWTVLEDAASRSMCAAAGIHPKKAAGQAVEEEEEGADMAVKAHEQNRSVNNTGPSIEWSALWHADVLSRRC